MNQQLAGQCAVITGAAHGIGRATALLFAQEGARVVIADVSAEGESVAKEIRAAGGEFWSRQTDVSSPEQMAALMDFSARAMGGIDIVVNNAGVQFMGVVSDFEPPSAATF